MSIQEKLNKMAPVAHDARLGSVLADIVAFINNQVAGANNVMTAAASLSIKAGSSPTVYSSTAFQAYVNGGLQNKTSATDMAAISGSVAPTKYAAWAFYIGPTGTLSASAKTADVSTKAAAVAAITAVALPDNVAQIGYIVVYNNQANTGEGGVTPTPFVGGTTALDAAGVTVTYVNASAVTLAIVDIENRTHWI